MIIGNQSDCNNDVEHRNTHPLLRPKAKAEGILYKQDIDVLRRVVGPTKDQEYKTGVKSESISLHVNTVVKQRSVLDDSRYGPGNRPHWALSRT